MSEFHSDLRETKVATPMPKVAGPWYSVQPDFCCHCGTIRPMRMEGAVDGTAIKCAWCGRTQDYAWHPSPDGIFEVSKQ